MNLAHHATHGLACLSVLLIVDLGGPAGSCEHRNVSKHYVEWSNVSAPIAILEYIPWTSTPTFLGSRSSAIRPSQLRSFKPCNQLLPSPAGWDILKCNAQDLISDPGLDGQ